MLNSMLGSRFKMKRLSSELAKGSFYGFTLKKGFWYGYDLGGRPVATSGWISEDCLVIYEKHGENWEPKEYPLPLCREILPRKMLKALNIL